MFLTVKVGFSPSNAGFWIAICELFEAEFSRLERVLDSASGVFADDPMALSISDPWVGSIRSDLIIWALSAVEIAVNFFIELSSLD